jgi:hypothetical protein
VSDAQTIANAISAAAEKLNDRLANLEDHLEVLHTCLARIADNLDPDTVDEDL